MQSFPVFFSVYLVTKTSLQHANVLVDDNTDDCVVYSLRRNSMHNNNDSATVFAANSDFLMFLRLSEKEFPTASPKYFVRHFLRFSFHLFFGWPINLSQSAAAKLDIGRSWRLSFINADNLSVILSHCNVN